MIRDKEFGIVRIRAFGTYAFRIVDASKFMREVFGTQSLVLTYPIIAYLTSILLQSVAIVIASTQIPVIDLAIHYKDIAVTILNSICEVSLPLGVEFTKIIIENISLPNEVEKMIDEQSGVGIAGQDMEKYKQYETIRAMRDAVYNEQRYEVPVYRKGK